LQEGGRAAASSDKKAAAGRESRRLQQGACSTSKGVAVFACALPAAGDELQQVKNTAYARQRMLLAVQHTQLCLVAVRIAGCMFLIGRIGWGSLTFRRRTCGSNNIFLLC
jgi:hypothetical protein